MLHDTASPFAMTRLFRHHVVARLAHVGALGREGHLADDEVTAIERVLGDLLDQPPNLDVGSEGESLQDAVDAVLALRLGPVAEKLVSLAGTHDQLTTDLRLWTREAILEACNAIVALQRALLAVCERHGTAVLPGYTRLQRTEPVLLGHHLLAYLEMFYRDSNRLKETYVRADILPLGAGEIAGAAYPLDRKHLATVLGMHTSTRNSLDAVGDRDYVVEHVAHLALVAMHLSRLTEDLMLWSSQEFGFVELAEAPPDGAGPASRRRTSVDVEQIRGKTGRVYGALMSVLTTMKALPLSYNGDLDELVASHIDAADTVTDGLFRASKIVTGIRWRTDRMADAAGPEANELLARHDLHGGTAVTRVRAAIGAAYEKVDALEVWIAQKRATLPAVNRLLTL